MTSIQETTRAKVRFYGDDIGFQFSVTGGGSRSKITEISNIHRATEEEKSEIKRMAYLDRDYRKGTRFSASRKTALRHIFFDDGNFRTFVGTASFRFKGEDTRKVKVFASQLKEYPIREWYSFQMVFDK